METKLIIMVQEQERVDLQKSLSSIKNNSLWEKSNVVRFFIQIKQKNEKTKQKTN